MKRNVLMMMVLLFAGMMAAQATPDTKQQDDAKQQQPAAKPAGGTKTAPEPKTKEEEAAMKAVIAKQGDPAGMLAAADDFAAKYPDSTVRGMLYRSVMLSYEQQGNADKSYEIGRKALTFDSDDPLTLAMCSMYLSTHTKDTDLDKNERLADAKKMANDAIANIDQLRVNNKAADAEKQQIRQFVLGQSYSSIAITAQVNKDWAGAEANYLKSIEANPDPATYVRLGFAQRMQNKLEPALASFNKAIELGNQEQATGVVQFAQQQKDSVQKAIDKQKSAAPAAPKQ